MPFRSSFYFNLSLTYVVLKVTVRCVKLVKTLLIVSIFLSKVIAIHGVQLRTYLILISQLQYNYIGELGITSVRDCFTERL